MKLRKLYRLPLEKERALNKAKRLEWITIGFMITIIIVIYLTLGNSQAMKTAWIEDLLSLVPPVAFLIAVRFRNNEPTERFPYGFRRSVAISFLVAAVALSIMGLYTIYDAAMALIRQEHPTIGMFTAFGMELWLGWIMIAALTYSAIPPVILGRMKLPLARELHEKTLHADADMNKADWLTGLAAILGIVGIGFGFWWADAVAAGVIALDITHDGLRNLKAAVSDLMDQRPTTVDREKPDQVVQKTYQALRQLPWVQDVAVRMREEGHVFSGEAFIVPRDQSNIVQRLQEATQVAERQDWQIYNMVITVVDALDPSDAI